MKLPALEELQATGLTFQEARELSVAVQEIISNLDHASPEQGPIPVWSPTEEGAADTNLALFMQHFQAGGLWQHQRTGNLQEDYLLLQQLSATDPEAFWPEVLQQLHIRFHRPPDRMLVLDDNPDRASWLPGARFNIAESALSTRDPDVPALLWAEEACPGQLQSWTLRQLRGRCMRVAAALRTLGFEPGQAIAIVMPMTAEAVALYLGIVWAGCVVVGIADSFAPAEIAARLRIAKAVGVFTQDVILRGGKALPLYQRVKRADAPRAFVVPQDVVKGLQVPLREQDLPFDTFLVAVPQHAVSEPHIGAGDQVTNILFSSGTTGEPKAIPWTAVTPLRCGADAWAHQDVRRGDVVAWPTSLGWMMGPWLIYAALLNGAAIALYQGSPLGRDFGVFVQGAHVTMLGLVPSIVRAWRASDCMKGLDWGALRCFSSSGEASAAEDYHWLMALAGYKPVIEYCGGTEIGGGFLTGCLLQPQAPAHFSTVAMGARLALLDGEGQLLYDSAAGSQQPGRAAFNSFGGFVQVAAEQMSQLWQAGSRRLGGSTDMQQQQPAAQGGNGEQQQQQQQQAKEQSLPVEQQRSVMGELSVVPPMLGSSQRLLNRSHYSVYYEGMPVMHLPGHSTPLRRHGDQVERLAGGYWAAHGRTDDTMNLGGIKVSSVELERCVVGAVAPVREAAAVGVPAQGGGPERLVLFLVLHAGSPADAGELRRQCQAVISGQLNPLFKVERVVIVEALPRTASNKVMRRLLRNSKQLQLGQAGTYSSKL